MSPMRYELGFYIPEDDILHSHRRENLKSYFPLVIYFTCCLLAILNEGKSECKFAKYTSILNFSCTIICNPLPPISQSIMEVLYG
jgi:hypothetical protein